MGLTITDSVPVITVLLQGFLSFFSPCVLPLLPIYIGYLSGGAGVTAPDGERSFDRKKVLLNTLCFVIGIGFSFFLLGLGMRAVGRFFSGHQLLFARIGGGIVILFGLYQLGVFGEASVLMREKRLPLRLDKMAMSPLTALMMGFVFSFAWTPCVGPTLSSVLLMAASANSSSAGFALVGVYTLGFALPFLLTGIFTTSLLSLFKQYRAVVRYTGKIAGVLLILMGLLMVTGQMNSITGYLSRISGPATSAEPAQTEAPAAADGDLEEPGTVQEEGNSSTENTEPEHEERALFPAPDFTLTDQYGVTHTLSDYQGKVVFLNFWATWCPPCRAELPYIQELYEEAIEDPEAEYVILGVAFPNLGRETGVDGIRTFLEENGYTYPVVMDTEASLMAPYYITAYPTTFMIDRSGNIFGYVPGGMTKEIMEDIIRQTLEGSN